MLLSPGKALGTPSPGLPTWFSTVCCGLGLCPSLEMLPGVSGLVPLCGNGFCAESWATGETECLFLCPCPSRTGLNPGRSACHSHSYINHSALIHVPQ